MRLICLILAALTLGVWTIPAAAQKTKSKPSESEAQLAPLPEPQSYCRKYRQNAAKVVLVGIDRSTNEIRPIDRTAITTALADLRALAAEGDRIVLFTLFDHPSSRRVLFDDCRPGGPVGWTDTPYDEAEKRADLREFDRQITGVVTTIRDDPKSKAPRAASRSAIASTLAAAVQTVRAEIKALILVSDLLDTETMNLRPDSVVEDHIRRRTLETLWSNRMIPRLGDEALVRVYGFGRGDEIPYSIIAQPVMNSIVQVWRDYFRRSGVDPARTDFVP